MSFRSFSFIHPDSVTHSDMTPNHSQTFSRQHRYDALGLMSGTSLDGLDILHVRFSKETAWKYELLEAVTVPYPDGLRCRLGMAMKMTGFELSRLSVDLGHFIGKEIRSFTEKNAVHPDFAAVHGHTVFHRPELGMTLQIGDGAAMAVESGLVIVNDFRSTDVALGGQGAPLVPIGDQLLFSDYDFCLNLGGISNISYNDAQGRRIAFDVSLCNIALNYFAGLLQMEYDKDGAVARSGCLNGELLEKLNGLDYFRRPVPKSLGYEFFEQEFLPVIESVYPDLEGRIQAVLDILHTISEHIACQISYCCRNIVSEPEENYFCLKQGDKKGSLQLGSTGNGKLERRPPSMLMTGGGALNLYLKERIASLSGVDVVAADRKLIDYKEALIFALLGVLRMEQLPNALASVTGAYRDSVGGAVYLP